jgi:hypothetical protein
MRDAHQQVAWLEQQVAAATQRTQQVHTALSENVGRLKAVAAARLPVLSGRKAARAQQAVDETVAAISAPTSDLLVRGAEAARAALDEQAAAGGAVVPVAEDDLENEVDLDGADAILDELRDELGLPAPTAGAATGDAGAPAGSGAESEDAAADEAAGGDPAGRGAAAADARGGGPAGADASGGSGDDRRVPASRR